MSDMVKFSSMLDEAALEELRSYSKQSGRAIASLLTEAVEEYLARVRVRPAFRSAVDEVLDEHDELLERLAR
jgi:glutamate-1-semialdehyde aminotransferase